MRTTLTLDDQLAADLKEKARRERKSFKEVVNEAIRSGLYAHGRAGGEHFTVQPHRRGFRPGVDLRRLNQLADELEVAEFVENPQ
ncbi:MAG: CopG family transcriptional regulator [bacterium]